MSEYNVPKVWTWENEAEESKNLGGEPSYSWKSF